MKLFSLLPLVFACFFSFSVCAQNTSDKKLIIRATDFITNNNYKNAEKQLKNVSIAGKETTEYLLLRADCNEKLTAYNNSAADYTTLYNKTKDVEFKKKAELMAVKYQIKLKEENLSRNCELCHGTGIVYEKRTCTACNGRGNLIITCTSCNGSGGYLNCYYCTGSGRITQIVINPINGQKQKEESACTTCSGTGQTRCLKCGGTTQESIRCNTCRGTGQIKTTLKCLAHN